ncbi:transglutaminase domain-containing protein [Clostridium lundense]|uniref:transglutaminase domain-containing protein n=1 Tax=Clostridium lundense TaxID=319475 RepID=UPI000686F631|nr:transglutaminase domain-containing protein [Clostridium lundense]
MKYFHRNLGKILISTIFFTFFIKFTVHSADFFYEGLEVDKNVPTDKVWNIKFNFPLNESTINKNNIYVCDSNNNYKNDINLIYNKDKKMIQVLPSSDYGDKEKYYLHIKNGLQAINESFLKEEKIVAFQTFIDKRKEVIIINTEEDLEKVLLKAIMNRENNIVLNMKGLGEEYKGAIEKIKNKIIKENPKLYCFNDIKLFYRYDEFMNIDLSEVRLYIDYFYFIDNNYLDYDLLGNVSCSLDKKVIICGDFGKIQVKCLSENENIKNISYSIDKTNIIDIDNSGNIKAIGEGEGLIKVKYEKYSKNIEDNNIYEYFFYIPIKVISKNSKVVGSKDELYNAVNEDFNKGISDISIYIDNKSMNPLEIEDVINGIFKEDYTGYYSIGNINYDYTKVKITYPYNISKKDYLSIRKNLENKADEVISKIIKKDMNDLQKEYAIHDYIVSNTAYDYDNFIKGTVPNEGYYPFGILMNGKGVCNGYALTMKMLLNKVGVECEKVDGTTSEGEHAWNIVKINNNYYHVDTTWDDPVPDDKNKISYQYFNMTDDEISSDHFWDKSIYSECNNKDFQFLRNR